MMLKKSRVFIPMMLYLDRNRKGQMKTLEEQVRLLKEEVARLIEVIKAISPTETTGAIGELVFPPKTAYPKIKWGIGTRVEWK